MPPVLMGGAALADRRRDLVAVTCARAASRCRRASRWGGIALMGFLMLVLGNGGVVYAEQWVPSGLAAVLVATSPFWMAGVEALDRQRRTADAAARRRAA